MSLTSVEAIAQARAFAARRGWPFRDDVHAESFHSWWVGPRRWRVVSHWGHRGGNVWIVIDDRSGEVLKANYIPR
jgi:hypothetical protein